MNSAGLRSRVGLVRAGFCNAQLCPAVVQYWTRCLQHYTPAGLAAGLDRSRQCAGSTPRPEQCWQQHRHHPWCPYVHGHGMAQQGWGNVVRMCLHTPTGGLLELQSLRHAQRQLSLSGWHHFAFMSPCLCAYLSRHVPLPASSINCGMVLATLCCAVIC